MENARWYGVLFRNSYFNLFFLMIISTSRINHFTLRYRNLPEVSYNYIFLCMLTRNSMFDGSFVSEAGFNPDLKVTSSLWSTVFRISCCPHSGLRRTNWSSWEGKFEFSLKWITRESLECSADFIVLESTVNWNQNKIASFWIKKYLHPNIPRGFGLKF